MRVVCARHRAPREAASAARIVPRASMRAGCPPPPPTQSLGMAAPPRGGASPALTRAIGPGHHPSILSQSSRFRNPLPKFHRECPTHPSLPSFLRAPRPDRTTNQPVGRRAGAPLPSTRTLAAREPSRAPSQPTPRRGSKLGAYVRYMDRARNRRGNVHECPRPPPEICMKRKRRDHARRARARAPGIAAAHKRTRECGTRRAPTAGARVEGPGAWCRPHPAKEAFTENKKEAVVRPRAARVPRGFPPGSLCIWQVHKAGACSTGARSITSHHIAHRITS